MPTETSDIFPVWPGTMVIMFNFIVFRRSACDLQTDTDCYVTCS